MQTRRGTSVPNTSGRPVSDPANNGIPTPAAIRIHGKRILTRADQSGEQSANRRKSSPLQAPLIAKLPEQATSANRLLPRAAKLLPRRTFRGPPTDDLAVTRTPILVANPKKIPKPSYQCLTQTRSIHFRSA